mgnify:CR=1 FL=1
MKTLVIFFISILFISTCFAQKDLLPAYPREINYRTDKGVPINEQVRASHIIIKTTGNDKADLQKANDIYNLLMKGEDFATVAKEKSDDGSKSQGGDLGWFGRGQMVKPFEDACFDGQIGVIQKPVKTQFGYHIIKVTDRTNSDIEGNIAYFNGSRFTGILFEEKTHKKLGEFKNGYKNGMFIEYYTNGKKKNEGKYIDGVKEGIHTEWFLNGNKKSDCKYVNGQREGISTDWFENKNKKSESNFVNGNYDGLTTEWFSNGQQKLSYTYNNGNLVDGKYVTYLENGQKEKEETYKNNQVIIFSKYENGKLIETRELSVEFYPSGQKKSEGNLINGKKEGLWTSWYEQGQKKSEGNYKEGNQEGQWTLWYEGGKIDYEGNYNNGLRDGKGIKHYEDGTIYNGELKNDKRDGQGIETFSDGSTYNGRFKNNKQDGYGTITLADGSINYQGEFKNGEVNGQGIHYDHGKKVYEGQWKNGKKNGKGTWVIRYDDGAMGVFIGELKDDEFFNGMFYVTASNGKKSTTEFKNGIQGGTIKTN